MVAVAWTSATANADPHVEVADLPPLPVATDAVSNSATLLAAADASEELVVVGAEHHLERVRRDDLPRPPPAHAGRHE